MRMKILTLIAILFSLNGYAQMKGKSALGLGVSIDNQNSGGTSRPTNESQSRSLSLGYGVFVSKHDKIGMEFTYGISKDASKSLSDSGDYSSDGEGYGGSLSYQHFYPIFKTLYAYAGARAGYNYSKSVTTYSIGTESSIEDFYSGGANGGLSWFMSKSFAVEVNVISLNATYTSRSRETGDESDIYSSKSSSFNLTTQGLIHILGFKVFLLF